MLTSELENLTHVRFFVFLVVIRAMKNHVTNVTFDFWGHFVCNNMVVEFHLRTEHMINCVSMCVRVCSRVSILVYVCPRVYTCVYVSMCLFDVYIILCRV